MNFSSDNSVQFGANEEFWLQWRQRFDPYIIDHRYLETSGSGEWKQVIIAQGDRTLANGSVLQGYACSENQLVIENIAGVGFPQGYLECGRYMNFEQTLGTSSTGSTIITRQNVKGSTCIFYPRNLDTSGCLRYYPNEWMTFMVHLRMGPVGTAVSSVTGISQPGFINSTYDFYVARQGQPLDLAHHQEGVVIPRGQFWNASAGINPDNPNDPGYGSTGWSAHDAHPDAKYGKVWLTPYHTNKDPTEVTENASIWYDEVIVSTQPIASPGGATAPATPIGDSHGCPRVHHVRVDRQPHLVLAERQFLHSVRWLERVSGHQRPADRRATDGDDYLHADLRQRFALGHRDSAKLGWRWRLRHLVQPAVRPH